MKPVFIQSWTIPRKYLWSANVPLAMSRMAAMNLKKKKTSQVAAMKKLHFFSPEKRRHKKSWCIHPLWHFPYFSKHIISEI